MAGLIDYASSVAGEAKKNVQGLLADPKQALKDILNNLALKAAAQQAATKAAWATRDPKIMAQNALDSSQTALGFAPLGITAWHGSPHKFNKFSMDKIGTGEGAQAYGHGLYLAESPEVAGQYAKLGDRYVELGGRPVDVSLTRNAYADNASQAERFAANAFQRFEGDVPSAVAFLSQKGNLAAEKEGAKILKKQAATMKVMEGQTYKTDIPDEAAARFLDWDKPVPEDVRQRVSKAAMEQFGSGSTGTSGEHLYKEIARELGNPAIRNSSPDASAWLSANGIPGIRYLDGGSRSAGQGSSNFVVFDPEMIRILERNGQATGAVPWQPGEWRGLLGNN